MRDAYKRMGDAYKRMGDTYKRMGDAYKKITYRRLHIGGHIEDYL